MSLSVALSHRFGDFALDVAFDTAPGVTVLFGASGSGKTSVVNAVAGLFRPDQGTIRLGGETLLDTAAERALPPHRRRIGYVFQEDRLFPHLSVRGNLDYGRRFAPRQAQGERFDTVVELLGIGALLDRRPSALSGGEKSRVAIGRALLAKPRLILADEPLAALDEPRKAEILPYFERLRDELAIPMLYVSHSVAEVARLATTVVVLENGKLRAQGTAAEVLSDASLTPLGPRAAGAVIEARVARHHDDGLTELDAGGIALFLPQIARPVGSGVRVRIAAHDILLSTEPPSGLSALNILPAEITALRPGGGPGVIVSLHTAAGPLLARITARSATAMKLRVGSRCHAIVKTVAVAPQDVGH